MHVKHCNNVFSVAGIAVVGSEQIRIKFYPIFASLEIFQTVLNHLSWAGRFKQRKSREVAMFICGICAFRVVIVAKTIGPSVTQRVIRVCRAYVLSNIICFFILYFLYSFVKISNMIGGNNRTRICASNGYEHY